MKQTNMEHFRGEIEAIMKGFEDFGVNIDNGKLMACSKSRSCERCKFSYLNNKNKEDPCTKHKIKWLMSEYKPEPVLTEREKHFVEFVQEGWIARDEKYNTLYWYSDKPTKDANEWQGEYFTWQLNVQPVISLLPFITWEDEEPWAVSDLRKLKVEGGEADD